jgi:tetratricopeptide (TPR) repeat protein
MSHYENIKQLFEKLINTTVPVDRDCCVVLLEIFPLLNKDEQKEFVRFFYKWAEENANQKPLIFCYAKCILALNYFYCEQHDLVLLLATEAQNLFAEQDEPSGVGVCLTILGSTYRTLGNVDFALKALWEGYWHLKKSDKQMHFLMACSNQLGSIYFEMQHYEEAIPLFTSTLEMAERVQNYFWNIYALHGLGKVYLMQKKYSEAKGYLEKAMIVAEKNNNPVTICTSLTELANYYFTVSNYPMSEHLHKQSLTIRERHQFIGGAITNCIQLGELYIKQSKPDEAVDVLQKGLKLAEQIEVKPKIYQIYLLLSEIYQTKNELEKSLFHYKKFHEIREQVEIEDGAKKIKNAQLVFEAEQTQKENIIIKKQKMEIEKKNIELQESIDELTRTKIGKKAKAFTLMIAIVLFVFEDSLLHFALHILSTDNYFLSLIVKMAIIFSLSPINKVIEKYLLKRVIKNKNPEREVYYPEIDFESSASPAFLPFHSRANG